MKRGGLGNREEELRADAGCRLLVNLLRGWSGIGLFVTGDGDVALAAARFTPPADLRPSQGQQTVSGQGAADRRLVHAGGEAVAAVELARDVTVVVLKKSRINTLRVGSEV